MIVFNFRKNSYIAHEDMEGIYFAETGENTIATFLLWMNRIPKSEPSVGKNVISLYLTDIPGEKLQYYKDLNEKLNGMA